MIDDVGVPRVHAARERQRRRTTVDGGCPFGVTQCGAKRHGAAAVLLRASFERESGYNGHAYIFHKHTPDILLK